MCGFFKPSLYQHHMFNLKDLGKAITQVAEEKGLRPESVIEAIESSLAAAYKKEYGQRGDVVRAKLNLKTGDVNFWQVKTVVDQTTVRIVEEEESLPEISFTSAYLEKLVRSHKNPDVILLVYNQRLPGLTSGK